MAGAAPGSQAGIDVDAGESEELTAERITAALGPDAPLGDPVQHYPVAVSVESLAQGWARQRDAPEGALVVAEAELSARGRRGQTWVSVAGRSLAFSVVLHPGLPPAGEDLLWLLASLAAAEGVEEVTGVDVRLKWPNDLRVDGRGLGGVRVDAHLSPGAVESAIITVRINVGLTAEDFPADVRPRVTSLAMQGAACSRAELLAAVLGRLHIRYGEGVPALLAAYRERCDTLGAQVTAHLMPTGETMGTAADVEEHGGLVLETATGRGIIAVDSLRRLEHGEQA